MPAIQEELLELGHFAVRDGSRWRLAEQHLSPIGGPLPFAGGTTAPERAK
jgi:hypothetical protein